MIRSVWIAAVVSVSVVAVLSGQTPKLAFDVASVKFHEQPLPPTPPADRAPNVFYQANATVLSLVRFAYGVFGYQVVGGPDWARTSRFEVHAKATEGASADQMMSMVRSLLEDRFELVVRHDQQEMPFLALVVARSDGRLGPHLERCPDPSRRPEPRAIPIPAGGRVSAGSCRPIDDVVARAIEAVGRPVVDKTGLTGLWTFVVTYALPLGSRSADPLAEVPAFPVALQEQLGLKLEPTSGPVDVLVIEAVQWPAEN